MNFGTKELIISVRSIILQFINSAPTVIVEFVISAYQIFQAQNLLGLPSKENPLELDENVIRQYFSEAQIRVHKYILYKHKQTPINDPFKQGNGTIRW